MVPTRTIGESLLALLLVLTALLCGMLAGATGVTAATAGQIADWPVIHASLGFGAAYAVLAWGLLAGKPWSFPVSVVLLALLLIAGLVDIRRREVMALGTTLTFSLAFATNLAVAMGLWLGRAGKLT